MRKPFIISISSIYNKLDANRNNSPLISLQKTRDLELDCYWRRYDMPHQRAIFSPVYILTLLRLQIDNAHKNTFSTQELYDLI